MQRLTPLQQVKERFGGKKKLVDELVPKLSKPEGMSTPDFKAKLGKASNQKLLHLLDTINEVQKKFKTKADLVDEILKLDRPTGKSVDKDYRDSLLRKTHAHLYDYYKSRARQEERKAAKKA